MTQYGPTHFIRIDFDTILSRFRPNQPTKLVYKRFAISHIITCYISHRCEMSDKDSKWISNLSMARSQCMITGLKKW